MMSNFNSSPSMGANSNNDASNSINDFNDTHDNNDINNATGIGNTNGINGINGIMNIIEIMKLFQSSAKEPPQDYIHQQPENTTSDIPNNIRVMTAIAPYINDADRKNLIIASKLMELMYLMNSFQQDYQERPTSSSTDKRSMLLAARPYVDYDKRDMVDLLITVIEISEILKKMERVNNKNAGRY